MEIRLLLPRRLHVLSHNVDCFHDRSGQLAFVFYASVERTAMLLPAITRT